MTQPRAVNSRIAWPATPAPVRAWVDTALGSPVVAAATQIGGMSPGAAVRVRTADGQRAFVKAVGSELNPNTPSLFRTELRVLERLAPVPYRATLRGGYDDGDWVAVLLDDVEGRFPDLDDRDQLAAVRTVVREQTVELTPAPAGLDVTSVAESARRWLRRWDDVLADPDAYLPGVDLGRIRERIDDLPDRVHGDTLCHFDVRDDNLLLRADGSAVIIDWGMARRGPAWIDTLLLECQPDDLDTFADRASGLDADPATVVDVLLAVAGSQAWNAQQPAVPNLGAMPAFCAQDAIRMLTRAERLLPTGWARG